MTQVVTSPQVAGVGQFGQGFKILSWIAARTSDKAVFAVVIIPRRNPSFSDNDLQTIYASRCQSVGHGAQIGDTGRSHFSVGPSGLDFPLASVVGEGSAAAVEPINNVLISLDLLIVAAGHQSFRVFSSYARHIEIGKAARQQVIIERVGADMT